MFIFYINDEYDDAANAFYKKHKVALPVTGWVSYTIREVMLVKDQYFLLLNEVTNKKMTIGKVFMEPGFHYARFTDVPGNVLEWEKVDNLYKNQHNNG